MLSCNIGFLMYYLIKRQSESHIIIKIIQSCARENTKSKNIDIAILTTYQ